jgi:hypothetical protein
MSLLGGRPRRPDDWPSSHVRARAGLSERLDGPIDPVEAEWLTSHLAACADCRAIDAAYASQRLELRALAEPTPEPPRDLWARTAAAIESEARFRDGRARSSGRRRMSLAPYALLSAALAVAVIVGSLNSSQRPGDGGTAGPSNDIARASEDAPSVASPATVGPGATPIIVAQRVEWLSKGPDGAYRVQVANVGQVCPDDATVPCDTAAPTEDRPVKLDQNASTVFGSPDGDKLIVVNEPGGASSGSVSVVSVAPEPSAEPTASPPASPSLAPVSPSPSPSTAGPSVAPSPPSTASPSPTPSADAPSPSVAVTPSPDTGTIEIARNVVLVGQSAAYSPSGTWFAFTARPADGSAGPDIYLWKVGEALANPVTTDHSSVFGSWTGDVIVGSTVAKSGQGAGTPAAVDLTPTAFLLDPATGASVPLAQAAGAWRLSVDPSGRQAVYWAGTIRETPDQGFAPDAGRLVLGAWDAASATPSGEPSPAAAASDNATGRKETTIAAGRMDDWDARWDPTGTHLAVWIADAQNPAVGRLSLYVVDAFDGRIELKRPLLDAKLAVAGFSLSDGQLVWAEPAADGSATGGRIQVLAWTDTGSGQVESVPGPVIVIR